MPQRGRGARMEGGRRSELTSAQLLVGTLAALAVITLPVLAWYSYTRYSRLLAEAQERECHRHLQVIYQAIQRYRADHHGAYPDSLAQPPTVFRRQPPITALVPQYLKSDALLVCPSDRSGGAKLGWSQHFTYIYGLQELMSSVPEARRRVQTV